MKVKVSNLTVVRDALHNAALDSGATDDYVKGVVLGTVAALMATNKRYSFDDAFGFVVNNLPLNRRANFAPEAWLKELRENSSRFV